MKATLQPVHPREWYPLAIEKELLAYLRETLYDPLLNLFGELRLNQAHERDHSALWDALLAGAVWYAAGVFSGSFDAAISRELRAIGARRVKDNFALPEAEIPIALKGAVAIVVQRSLALHQAILSTLEAVESHTQAPTGFSFSAEVEQIAEDLGTQLDESLSEVGQPPAAEPQELPEQLREKAVEDLNLAIKNFTLEQTRALRERVRANLSGGGRIDRLRKVIEMEFGVGQRKARFLADQETSLLVSKYRERRYRALGSTEYIWETSGDEKVRPTHGETNNHRVLNGRKFMWDAPPVVDSATGRRCHPGEDFGPCRCLARPVLNFN